MERWVGGVALVTGASAGIGAAICRELVKQGMTVVGCARRVEKIEDIAKEDEMSAYPGKLYAIKCDMSREEEILAMHKEIKNQFGCLDVCINNAMDTKTSPLLSGDASDWRYLLEVGIIGLCINTREAVKLMKDNGQIIHLGSVVGHKIPPFRKPSKDEPTPWFHMSIGIKTMIRALAEGLRQELKAMDKSIRVATLLQKLQVKLQLVGKLSLSSFQPNNSVVFQKFYLGRKRRIESRTRILTSSLEKALLAKKVEKKRQLQIKRENKFSKNLLRKKPTRRSIKDVDSSSDVEAEMVLDDSSSYEENEENIQFPKVVPDVHVDDYVLVRFPNDVLH